MHMQAAAPALLSLQSAQLIQGRMRCAGQQYLMCPNRITIPEVVGAEGRGEPFPDEAPPVIALGGKQIGLLLIVRQLHSFVPLSACRSIVSEAVPASAKSQGHVILSGWGTAHSPH